MNFSEALELLKAGRRLKRTGWNGKNQFVFLVKETRIAGHLPYLAMRTVQENVIPWLASQTDLLADDWIEFGSTEQLDDDFNQDKVLNKFNKEISGTYRVINDLIDRINGIATLISKLEE